MINTIFYLCDSSILKKANEKRKFLKVKTLHDLSSMKLWISVLFSIPSS